MSRLMRDATFRDRQVAGLRGGHIAPINALVDDIVAGGSGLWAPYVAPMYGGTDARVLSVLRDPGPKTNTDHGGSGFLCMENDDPTAERLSGLFEAAGISATEVVPWNAYPWYINKAPTAGQLEAGVEPMRRLVALLPNLMVVMLHGGSAHDGWRRLLRRHPEIGERKLTVIETYHTSRQAFWHRDPAERQRRGEHLEDAFRQAALALGAGTANSV
jgi:Uracil DNA glycosylase superfamily